MLQYNERAAPGTWLDTEFSTYGTPEEPQTSTMFGPEFISNKLYQLSPPEVIFQNLYSYILMHTTFTITMYKHTSLRRQNAFFFQCIMTTTHIV